MAGYFLVGMLAAFGLLSVFWIILGWLLPGGKGCALVCAGEPDPGIVSRYWWLCSLGLLHCPLLILSANEWKYKQIKGMETLGPEELLSRLEEERYAGNGTGNGDSAGRDQRRGISEL